MTTRQNLTIRQGETFSYTYAYKDSAGNAVDLTGNTAVFKIASYGEGSVSLGGASGSVTLSLTASQTKSLGNESGFGAYADVMWGQGSKAGSLDFERAYTVTLTDEGGASTRVLEGLATVVKDV